MQSSSVSPKDRSSEQGGGVEFGSYNLSLIHFWLQHVAMPIYRALLAVCFSVCRQHERADVAC